MEEKKTNGYFVACYVISFIIIGFYALCILIFANAIQVPAEQLIPELEAQGVEDPAGAVTLMRQMLRNYIIVLAITAVVALVIGILYVKASHLTDEQASNNYTKLLILTIVSYIFGGLIVGIISTIGLSKVAKQKDDYLRGQIVGEDGVVATNAEPQTQEPKQEEKPTDVDKIVKNLDKLEELKSKGALTDEEYEELRKKIISNK